MVRLTACAVLDHVVFAGSALLCKHLPQVSRPDMLAEHIRTSTLPYLG
jgi:hypothetical protein